MPLGDNRLLYGCFFFTTKCIELTIDNNAITIYLLLAIKTTHSISGCVFVPLFVQTIASLLGHKKCSLYRDAKDM